MSPTLVLLYVPRLRSFPEKSVREMWGFVLEKQAQSLGLGCCLGKTLPSSGSCPAHSVLGLLASGGTSACGKTCQAPPAPSLPFAWCSLLGSVADTEDFLLCCFPFSTPKGRKVQDGDEQLCFHTRKDGWLTGRGEPGARGGHSHGQAPSRKPGTPAIFAQA